ncbi:hypothetical protein CVT26_010075 [Gymnopilus dilepis]|uniref:Fatty acid desaturase domain-containing protein n=1 Tax=Gymnopilus dilepis TaxID=231916 RepID=A0A409VWP0_9AGAR|nr:hypothetical protein CVT26_010075 [Gymnopilus dilepis]
MPWFQNFQDGPEYEARKRRGKFTPPVVSLKQLRHAIPPHLFRKSTARSLAYLLRHFAIMCIFYRLATRIDAFTASMVFSPASPASQLLYSLVRPSLWTLYWGWQGITFAGLWCLAGGCKLMTGQAGHNALSPYPLINAIIGITVHTLVLTPYYSWRITHSHHHKSTNNIERDETYIPPTRQDLKLPEGKVAVRMDYMELLEETPAYTLFKLFVRQFLKGNPRYPSGTSHYKPSSKLFRPKDRSLIIMSDAILVSFLSLLAFYAYKFGFSSLSAHYFMPWIFAHNWYVQLPLGLGKIWMDYCDRIVLFTYLQHSDPTIPYYRKEEWTFARGALATVDRPLFGWVGRFFLHNISTDHVAHHFFPTIPFYNLPEVTKAIIPVLGDYYNYDSTPAIYALWRSFTQCTFVESEGAVLFFRNQYGEALIEPQANDH